VYAPFAPAYEIEKKRQPSYEINNYNRTVKLKMGDANLGLFSVSLSSQVRALMVGPVPVPAPLSVKTNDQLLSINMSIDVKRGTLSFNTQDFVLLVGKPPRILSPISFKKTFYRYRKRKYESEEIDGTLIKVGKREKEYLYHTFTFNIPRTNLPPFVFRLGNIEVNGKVYTMPEIQYKKWSGYRS
jgi:hypothetical protein